MYRGDTMGENMWSVAVDGFTGALNPVRALTPIFSIFYLIYEGARKAVLLPEDNFTFG